MAYDRTTPLEERYCDHSPNCVSTDPVSLHRYAPLDRPQEDTYFEKFKLDAALLKEALSPPTKRPDATIAEQVFGGQARDQRIGLGHIANVLYERARLHKKQLADIDWRLADFKDRLSVIKVHFPLDGGRAQHHLEKLIIALEKQRWEEELAFWNDTVQLRQKLFEGASTYTAARQRYWVLSDLEGTHDR